jgi:hypothetical protein
MEHWSKYVIKISVCVPSNQLYYWIDFVLFLCRLQWTIQDIILPPAVQTKHYHYMNLTQKSAWQLCLGIQVRSNQYTNWI